MKKNLMSLALLGIICVENVQASLVEEVEAKAAVYSALTVAINGEGAVGTSAVGRRIEHSKISQTLLEELTPERIGMFSPYFRFKDLSNETVNVEETLRFGGEFQVSYNLVNRFYCCLNNDLDIFNSEPRTADFTKFMYETFTGDFLRLIKLCEKEEKMVQEAKDYFRVELSTSQCRAQKKILSRLEKLMIKIDALSPDEDLLSQIQF
jgi:hypothetical protein